MKKTNQKGFTLIELLVVIAIIGLLATLAVLALNSARVKARDAKRVADMQSLQTAMEMLASENGSYAVKTSGGLTCGADALGKVSASSAATCNILTYLPGLANLKDPSGTTACTVGSTAVCDYAWGATTNPLSFSSMYSVVFYLEGVTGSLSAGVNELDQKGLHANDGPST